MQHILPFETNPYSTMYHNTAFPLGIIMANARNDGINLDPWLASRYIHCAFDDRSTTNKFNLTYAYFNENWAVEDKALIRHNIKANFDKIDHSNWNIIDFLKNSLKTGHYPNGIYNEQMIHVKEAYRKRYYLHDYMLYGYDDQRKCFLSVGYISGKYQPFTIPYANMKAALLSCRSKTLFVDLWSYNRNAEFRFDAGKLKRNLKMYLFSEVPDSTEINNKISYGITAVLKTARHLQDSIDIGHSVDLRYTRGIMEHKFFMALRIRYLTEIGRLKDASLVRKADDVYAQSQRVHLLGLKYNMTGKRNLEIMERIEKMTMEEKEYLPAVLSGLER